MTDADFKRRLKEELPTLVQQDPEVRQLLQNALSGYFADRAETESRFNQVLAELRHDREQQALRWEANERRWEEQSHRWQEQDRKWSENQRHLNQIYQEIKGLHQKHEGTVGALGARWGIASEQSFRDALKGILERSFGVEVLNVTEYDDTGEVFGRPDQVELDLIIKNGDLIICELKSSMSKADVYTFAKKVEFYEKRHQRQATRKIIVTPMLHPVAQGLPEKLGIEAYSYSDKVKP
jgi:hypothetical protein